MFNTDSFGNVYFPAGVSVASIPATTGTQNKVLVPGPGGRISSASIPQLITQSGGNLVSSIFGRTGVVTAALGDYNTDQITEGQALYFSDSRARKVISVTTFNTSGPATYDSTTGIINIPQYGSGEASPTNFVPLTRKISINGQTADLSVDRMFSVEEMVYPPLGIPVSNGTSWAASITNNSANWNTAFSWGNHAGLYSLLGHTHTFASLTSKPTTLAGYGITDAATSAQGANADTAFGWGNHALAGYLTSFTETDPTVPSHVKAITTTNITNWNTAYSWGNHALAGYLTSFTETDPIWTSEKINYYTKTQADGRYLQSYTETDPVWTSEKINYYTKTQADGRYLQSFTETDPIWTSEKANYALKTYVDTSISNLIDSAPTTLDTLNELAAALGDDANFSTSITTLIGTKEPAITAGTTAQYWRGDKTWQTLPIYTLSGLGGEPSIAAGTTAQYWRGDKSWQTLPIYTLSGLGGVPTTRTLTINGTAYNLSADREWTINSMVYPGAGIAVSTGTAWGPSITDNSANWNSAFTDRFKWDGGATGLVAATGRTSLGLGTAATSNTGDFAAASHTHIIANVTGLQTALDGKENAFTKNTAFNKNFGTTADTVTQGNDARLSDARTPTAHTHPISDITGLQTALDGKAASVHTHTIDNVTGLQTALDGKEPTIVAGTTGQYWRGDKTWQTLPSYSLPIATASLLGGIKVGSNLSINATTGVLDATYTYTLPTASPTVLGGIKVGSNLSIDANGVLSAGNSYVLPTASASVLGGIKVGTNLSIDANGVLSSTDTNTTYANFTRTVAGLVPTPGGSTTNRYLREDGTWVIPPDTDTNTWVANSVNVAGYVAAPGAVANKVWKTDGSGNPAWRDDADTDTVYVHPTTAGNKHIPAGGAAGQILRYSSDGTAVWGADNDTTYVVFTRSANGLTPAAPAGTGTTRYLREDGTWQVPPDTDTDTNTTYSNFTRTVSGLVPNPGGSSTNRYLREDGTWVVPPDTDTDTNTWNANSRDVAGYVAAPGAIANKVWKTDASGNPAWRDDADTDTNTTYTNGAGLTLSGTTFSVTKTITASETADTIALRNGSGQLVATGFFQASSRTLKTNITPFTRSALDIIREVTVVSFNYKTDVINKHIGFIAEDTPEELSTRSKNVMDSNNTIGVLLKAIQELESRIKTLESK